MSAKPTNLTQLSKFLALILRHNPGKIGLHLDEHGWANISELIECAKKAKKYYTPEIIEEIVRTDEKGRYSISEDQTMIRANQGHSIQVDMQFKEMVPPDVLYHGTAERFLDSIMSQGLKKMQRQYVHLSSDVDTAAKVGIRHGKLAILQVNASKMVQDGIKFFISENHVWLTDNVPPEYLNRIQ